MSKLYVCLKDFKVYQKKHCKYCKVLRVDIVPFDCGNEIGIGVKFLNERIGFRFHLEKHKDK